MNLIYSYDDTSMSVDEMNAMDLDTYAEQFAGEGDDPYWNDTRDEKPQEPTRGWAHLMR
jgi:hypothetical protein